jgi:hypothetical protein
MPGYRKSQITNRKWKVASLGGFWAQLRTTAGMMWQERSADHRIGVNLANAATWPKRCSALRRWREVAPADFAVHAGRNYDGMMANDR